jgi:hypothetical protein
MARPVRGWLAVGLGIAAAALLVPAWSPATVAEQRQRLPPPAECTDPISGVWRAHVFRPDRQRWALNTMELRWNADRTKLLSSYENHYWSGGPEDSEPPQPPCKPGQYRRMASSTGEGTYRGNQLEVQGKKLGGDENICGSTKFTRALGKLTGIVDLEQNEFRSEMTSRFGTHPIIWRRIRCVGEAEPKLIEPPPPPPVALPPSPPSPSSKGSCGCSTVGAA